MKDWHYLCKSPLVHYFILVICYANIALLVILLEAVNTVNYNGIQNLVAEYALFNVTAFNLWVFCYLTCV